MYTIPIDNIRPIRYNLSMPKRRDEEPEEGETLKELAGALNDPVAARIDDPQPLHTQDPAQVEAFVDAVFSSLKPEQKNVGINFVIREIPREDNEELVDHVLEAHQYGKDAVAKVYLGVRERAYVGTIGPDTSTVHRELAEQAAQKIAEAVELRRIGGGASQADEQADALEQSAREQLQELSNARQYNLPEGSSADKTVPLVFTIVSELGKAISDRVAAKGAQPLKTAIVIGGTMLKFVDRSGQTVVPGNLHNQIMDRIYPPQPPPAGQPVRR